MKYSKHQRCRVIERLRNWYEAIPIEARRLGTSVDPVALACVQHYKSEQERKGEREHDTKSNLISTEC